MYILSLISYESYAICKSMGNISSDRIQGTSPSAAFIFYRPQTEVAKEQVFYNAETWHILSLSSSLSKAKEGTASFPDISFLCSRWKELLDKGLDELKESGEGGKGAGFIDILQSQRRRYTVKGIVLSGQPSALQQQEKQYLFILERFNPDSVNLSMIFRQWNLNHREQDIARLLLADRSNKEIAHALGLSLNTVKGYMKLLMRKLGVNSRAGIIANFLTGRNPSS